MKLRMRQKHSLDLLPAEILRGPIVGKDKFRSDADKSAPLDYPRHFIERSAESSGIPVRALSADTLAALQAYDWPGNVRQLRNLMDWLLIMAPGASGDPIRADMLPPEIGSRAPALLNIDPTADIMSLPLREARDLFETQYLHAQLLRFGGNISRTAQFVGMERSALHRKLKQLGVNSDERVGR